MQEITRSRGLWKGLLLAMLVPLLVYAYEFGPPSGYTGGFNEPNCTECHFGTAVNTGGGNVRITLPATYASGATVPVTVTITDATASRWGFELSARTQEGKQAGTLIPGTDRFTQLQTPLAGIQYIEHTLNGTRPGTRNSQTFNFTWTAPNTSAGPVVFNVSANAANNNNLQTGDKIYTSNGTVQPAAAAGPTPAVPDNAVVNNASFAAGTNALAPGTIAAIFGSDLNDGTSNPFSSFSNGKLLTTLGGASVTFNGIAAPIFSSFATQLNVQIPFELAGSTSASVVVTVAGRSSPPKTVPIGSVLPGIFSTTSDGKGQGAIQIANTTIFAAPAGSIAGVQTRPANRGEFLTIF